MSQATPVQEASIQHDFHFERRLLRLSRTSLRTSLQFMSTLQMLFGLPKQTPAQEHLHRVQITRETHRCFHPKPSRILALAFRARGHLDRPSSVCAPSLGSGARLWCKSVDVEAVQCKERFLSTRLKDLGWDDSTCG